MHAQVAAQDRWLPEAVRETFEALLRCGVVENGVLRVVCEHCRIATGKHARRKVTTLQTILADANAPEDDASQ